MSVIFMAGMLPIFPPSKGCRPSEPPPMGPFVIPPPRRAGWGAACPLACPPCANAMNGEEAINPPPRRNRRLFMCPPLFDFENRLDFHRRVPWQRGHADGRPCVLAHRFAEHLDHQIGESIDD